MFALQYFNMVFFFYLEDQFIVNMFLFYFHYDLHVPASEIESKLKNMRKARQELSSFI